MSNPGSSPKGPKVSPVRTIVSLVMLVIVGGISVIELRAGLGQYLSVKELKKTFGNDENAANQKTVTFEEAKALLRMGPSESVPTEGSIEKVYQYTWFSVLRPLMGETSPEIYIRVTAGNPPLAIDFFTSAEDAQGGNYKYQTPPVSEGGAAPMPAPMPGMGGPGMGGPRGARPPGGGMMRPPADNPEGGFGGGGGRGRRPATEGEAPAGEEGAKPADGEAKPADGEAKPADGEAKPADGGEVQPK